MSKTTKRSRSRTRASRSPVDRTESTDIMTQLACAIRNPQAALIGALLGGLVPWFGRTLAHEEIPSTWAGGNHGLAAVMLAVVLGCACFSALSVYRFGKAAFGDAKKALGFVLALEGVMLISHGATSTVALAVLILINAVANGSVIALARDATRRRCEADARRAATRAKNRSAGSEHRRAPATAPQPPRPVALPVKPSVSAPVAAPMPTWRRPSLDDVIDAEIVSEQRFLA